MLAPFWKTDLENALGIPSMKGHFGLPLSKASVENQLGAPIWTTIEENQRDEQCRKSDLANHFGKSFWQSASEIHFGKLHWGTIVTQTWSIMLGDGSWKTNFQRDVQAKAPICFFQKDFQAEAPIWLFTMAVHNDCPQWLSKMVSQKTLPNCSSATIDHNHLSS